MVQQIQRMELVDLMDHLVLMVNLELQVLMVNLELQDQVVAVDLLDLQDRMDLLDLMDLLVLQDLQVSRHGHNINGKELLVHHNKQRLAIVRDVAEEENGGVGIHSLIQHILRIQLQLILELINNILSKLVNHVQVVQVDQEVLAVLEEKEV